MIAARETTNEPSGALQTVNAEPDPVTIDPNGNTTQKVEGADTWAYTWSAENQLTRVTKNGAEVARFAYDPLGRRVEKVAGGVTTTFAYDGEDILRESRGATTLKYVHGPGIDEPLAKEDASGALSSFHADGLGSVVKTTNASGAVSSTLRYNAFGVLETGSPSPFGFTAREFDSETGLLYLRARYLDPRLGRFLSEDPIAFFGGINFYRYVNNNPVNLRDPFGLAPEEKQCCASEEEPEIRRSMEKINRRLDNLKKNGTALLPEELAGGSAIAGGVSGCASNGQYFVTINPDLTPCIRKCVIFHEKTHERQCRNLGPERFANLPEPQSETPAYMNELGCLIKILRDAGRYP